jgi:hypothetical protein
MQHYRHAQRLTRNATSAMLRAMPSIAKLLSAGHEMCRLLEREGLPLPDDAEFREDEEELVLFWDDAKVAVVIECRQTPPAPMGRGGFQPPSDGL